jgi:hypothetical protein
MIGVLAVAGASLALGACASQEPTTTPGQTQAESPAPEAATPLKTVDKPKPAKTLAQRVAHQMRENFGTAVHFKASWFDEIKGYSEPLPGTIEVDTSLYDKPSNELVAHEIAMAAYDRSMDGLARVRVHAADGVILVTLPS